MSALVRVIDDLGALLVNNEYNVILGHAPGTELDNIAITFVVAATPGAATIQWLLFGVNPVPTTQRFIGEGKVDLVYDLPRQLLQGFGQFTVGYMELLTLKVSLLAGATSSLEQTVITAKFSEPEQQQERGD